jgi:DNA-binding FrmR family transcriptional regulator
MVQLAADETAAVTTRLRRVQGQIAGLNRPTPATAETAACQ